MKSANGSKSKPRQKPELHFDQGTHTYYLDGVRVPSVTQIIKRAGLMQGLDWVNPHGLLRGQYVACTTEYYDRGELDLETIDDQLLPYLNGWIDFLKKAEPELLGIEELVCNPEYGYAGKLDRRLVLRGEPSILDIKLGQHQPWHGLQTAAYAACFEEAHQRYSLILKEDESYRLMWHKDSDDLPVFRAALAVVNFKKKKGYDEEDD